MWNIFRKLDQIRLPILSLIAGCLVACSIDWPTPVVVQKDATVAFPCQTRGCGCQNADQCWKSCCCFSDAEKLAWAKANRITPPNWFIEKMAAAKTAHQAPENAVSMNAVSAKKTSSCCCCCQSKSGSCSPTIDQPGDQLAQVAVHLTLSQQRGCNGQLDYQLQHLVYLPLDVPVDPQEQEFPCFSVPAAILTSFVMDLPTPPPRDFSFA